MRSSIASIRLRRSVDGEAGGLGNAEEPRVEIARTIVTGPALIPADEPTGNPEAASAVGDARSACGAVCEEGVLYGRRSSWFSVVD